MEILSEVIQATYRRRGQNRFFRGKLELGALLAFTDVLTLCETQNRTRNTSLMKQAETVPITRVKEVNEWWQPGFAVVKWPVPVSDR